MNNPASWTLLTPSPISQSNYADSAWDALPSGTYYWAVKAIHPRSIESSAAISNPLVKLSAPNSVDITYDSVNGRLTISWAAVAGASSYRLYASTNPYGTYSLVHTTNQTSWFTVPLPTDVKKFYKVVATNP